MTRLSVNVDHVATLRQARGVRYPSPVEAARLAEAAGAAGITVHLRADRRHIQDDDVRALRETVAGKLNLEMAASDAMLALALDVRPDQVTLVPERPDELTTEGGLDLVAHGTRVLEIGARLHEAGIATSVFLDPQAEQIERLAEAAARPIAGFELNTDAYTRASGEAVTRELESLREAAAAGGRLGLAVFAGHGLHPGNVGSVAAIPAIEELNIGHALVARAVLIGLGAAVREMLAAMRRGEG